MRAALLTEYDAPLEVTEVSEPEPSPKNGLVRVRAAGVCGTDLKLISGALAGSAPPPMIPGHEIAGELVSPAAGLEAGQRVACYLYSSCGACRWCIAGQNTLCPEGARLGIERDGGLAEFVSVPVNLLLPFGDHLPFAAAAVAMDAVASPWAALHGHAQLTEGQFVVVVGAGGLGTNGVQIAKAAGAFVAAVDVEEGNRLLAKELGADIAVAPDRVDELCLWSAGGADIALETSGSRAGFLSAVESVRPGGIVVCCGYQPGAEYGVESMRLVLEELTIAGSRAASPDEARAALAAVERGVVTPSIMQHVPLDRVNDALELLRRREVRGRMVIDL